MITMHAAVMLVLVEVRELAVNIHLHVLKVMDMLLGEMEVVMTVVEQHVVL